MGEQSQLHYILGYVIVLTSHNWQIMVCLACGIFHGARLFRHPNPYDVRLLYAWGVLGFAYEYRKHLQGVLDNAVDFLLVWHYWRWNSLGHLFTELFWFVLVAVAIWMFMSGRRVRGRRLVAFAQVTGSITRAGLPLAPPVVERRS